MGSSPTADEVHGEMSERYGRWAELAGVVLVVGLVIAVYEVSISSKPWAEKWLSLLSEIFIVGGVGFEIWFGRLSRKAGDRVVAEANARASTATQKTEELRLENLKLASKIAPRRLMAEDARMLVRELQGKIPPLYIRCLGTAEVQQYAYDFFHALCDAGLVKETPPRPGMYFGNPGFAMSEQTHWARGVSVYLPPDVGEHRDHNLDPLVLALKAANVPITQTWSGVWEGPPLAGPGWEPGHRILVIGEKPIAAD